MDVLRRAAGKAVSSLRTEKREKRERVEQMQMMQIFSIVLTNTLSS